jgi:enoyl-CoA hydratase
VTSPAELLPATEETLRTILTKGPIAVKLSLEAVQHGMELPLEEGIQLEANLFGLACTTEDFKEGTRAFIEKRKAEFKGN